MTIYFSVKKSHLKPLPISTEQAKKNSLMTLLLEAKIPVASSCKGDGICSKCRVQIILGQENVNGESQLETKTKNRNKIDPANRLSCQLHVHGDITIDTDYW